MAATAILAFIIVATATVFVAHRIARHTALGESERTARSMADAIFIPALPAVLRGDRAAIATLQPVLAARRTNGSIVRLKVWTRDGTIVFSDDPDLIGRHFALQADLGDVIDNQVVKSVVSNLDDADNGAEGIQFNRLVEVSTPITLADGTQLVFEIYSTDARVVEAENSLTNQLIPLSLGSLVILLIAQLPLSMWLVKRVVVGQQERGRLLRNSLIASSRERRTIARELHDGVVQDLAGVGYAVGALTRSLTDTASPGTARTLDRVSGAVQDSVSRLRTLMVDIYPPDLSSDGLCVAIEGLSEALRTHDIAVELDLALRIQPTPEIAATLYRCVREGIANVVKHAAASHVHITLTSDADNVELWLTDDGRGCSATDIDRRAEGHLGLQLLRDAAIDLGGELTVSATPGGGTTLTVQLPIEGLPSL